MDSTDEAAAAASVPMSRQIDFTAKTNGQDYRVQIALPLTPAPEGGYATLYVLDGDINFGAFAGAARMRALTGELAPAVVVGIGYPEAQEQLLASLMRRNADLTPTQGDAATRERVSRQLGGLDVGRLGGADDFLEVIEREIKPRVAALAPVAPGRDVLFGHSLGGLFVLHALFARPQSFATFLALSPSIWWDGEAVLRREDAFSARVARGEITPRVFIGVGGREQNPAFVPQLPAAEVLAAAMVDNARGLGERLAGLAGGAGYAAFWRVFDDQSHLAVVSTSMSTLLDFGLPPEG
ncbi:MAG TPA: alpha/beta hydrolase-fold protein [Caulobacteraceae bacterium]|nr:alpha/beta hydrolase-fold protein [Caulobacteraceae bacterium]